MVVVAENVADAGDGLPGDRGLFGLQIGRKMPARLGEDLEVALDQLPRTAVRAKLLEVVAGRVGLDVGDRLEHVLNVDCGIALH